MNNTAQTERKEAADGRLIRFYNKSKRFMTSFIVLIIFVIIALIVAPGILSIQGISSLLMAAGLLILPALGQSTVIAGGNFGIDLSAGATMSLCALLAPAVITNGSVNIPLSVLTVLGVGFMIGIINGCLIKILRMPPMILTLIVGYVVDGFAWWVMDGRPITTSVAPLPNVCSIVVMPFRILSLIAIAVVILMALMLNRTRFGNSILLVGNNSNTAAVSGFHVDFVRIATYCIAGMLYGLAGLLLTGYSGTTAMYLASDYTMLSVAAAVIGGTKLSGGVVNYYSVALGALCLTLLTLILQALNMTSGMRLVCEGALLFIILLINNRTPKLS